MQAGPLQSYLDKWLQACPYQRQAVAFIDAARYPGHLALAALEFEWLSTAYHIQETAVAAAKLHWWLEELDGAAVSGGRHPLTQVLFDQPQARQLPTAWWTAPVLAAIERLEQGTAADFPAQLAAAAPLHGGLARLETGWWYGPEHDASRAQQLAACSQLLSLLGQLPQQRDRDSLPLPMQRLARHHLSRQDLGGDSEGLQQAVREQAQDLLAAMQAALASPGRLSVFRQLQARVDRRLLNQVATGGRSVAVAGRAVATPGLRTLWQAWRAARQWQQALA